MRLWKNANLNLKVVNVEMEAKAVGAAYQVVPKEELEEAVEDVKEEIAELVEDEDHDDDDYEDEFLSLEELLVCIVTENLYILIWPKPYYILDRRCFEEGKDAEFRAFIEEHARIIEA